MTNDALKSELRESAITMANLPTEFGVACLTEAGAQRIAKVLTDAATALEAMEAGGWLPIESAPQDGTVYWATDGKTQREENHPGDGFYAGRWWLNRHYGGWFGAAHGGTFKATHYRALPPLPTPPKD